METLLDKLVSNRSIRSFLDKHPDKIDIVGRVRKITRDKEHLEYAFRQLDGYLHSKPEKIEHFLEDFSQQIRRERKEVSVPRNKGWSVQSARRKVNAEFSKKRPGVFNFYRGYDDDQGWKQELGLLKGFRGRVTLHGEPEYVTRIEYRHYGFGFGGNDANSVDRRRRDIGEFRAACESLLSSVTRTSLWNEADALLNSFVEVGLGAFSEEIHHKQIHQQHLTETGYRVSLSVQVGWDWTDRTFGDMHLNIRASECE